ncbi:MAG TPA: GAF domain-containing SpoIIE family protein phosphatase [Ktedonobacteraceae bacterium]|nr:GAF domain-containing SpoIIE family protein phosphatase [Ktedonobacteraceae bacterium]
MADTPLHRRWLGLARVGWVVVVVLALFLFVESILSVNALLHQICTGAAATCITHGLLAAGDVRRLHELGLSRDFYATYTIGIMSLSALGYWVVATFLFWRTSDDRVALLAAFSLALFPMVINDGLINRLPSPWWSLAQVLSVLGFFCLVLFGCVFPSGHFVPRFTRWLLVVAPVYWGFDAFFPSSSLNPLAPSQVLGGLIFLGIIGGIVVAQLYRYQWVSSPEERQQTKWVVYGVSMGVGGHLVLFTLALFIPSLFQTGSLGDLIKLAASYGFVLLVPLSLGFATVSSRLWEIDVLINRTLIYGSLTGTVALVYVGLVLSLQTLLRGIISQDNSVVIVLSTLAIAALFQPLRHRLQRVIDRRFYRRTYDAAQTLTAFGTRLQQRDEVDLATLSADLLAVVQITMQPTRGSLWLRPPAPGIEPSPTQVATPGDSSPVILVPTDPLVGLLLSAHGTVETVRLHLDSPALRALQADGVKLAVPLVSQGELVGLLQLGPRKSEQDYSSDDRGLLNQLAIQAAPAIQVAQLVREQQAQALERERLEQELCIAQQIQRAFLPRDLPELVGWQVATYYQPARAVGGDFYDFLPFADGRLGIVIGDVSGKGIPAALLMTTTRTILRSVARHEASPGQVLEQTNALLCPEMLPGMFVTCLYALLDPASGCLRYANAGHDQPYQRQHDRVSELWATGMPLGLMAGMTYEEKETMIADGDSVLWYSDGLVEAHNRERAMFGFPQLTKLLEEQRDAPSLIDVLVQQLTVFTGPNWEQEDDVTLVTVQRSSGFGGSVGAK